jgi:hypothetical protein
LYVNYEITAFRVSDTVGFASIRQSIAANGIAANAVQANNLTASNTGSNNAASVVFKSPVTVQVTTLFALTEIL